MGERPDRERIVIEIQEGLQEHEGRSYYVLWGRGKGATLLEVCRDIIGQHPEKAKHFRSDGPDRCTDWGFRLVFLEEKSS